MVTLSPNVVVLPPKIGASSESGPHFPNWRRCSRRNSGKRAESIPRQQPALGGGEKHQRHDITAFAFPQMRSSASDRFVGVRSVVASKSRRSSATIAFMNHVSHDQAVFVGKRLNALRGPGVLLHVMEE